MIPEGENRGDGRDVGYGTAQNHPPVAEVKAVKKTQGQVTDGFSRGGGSQRVGQVHERRMREISGREMR